jgi:F-type H+-transporting ATPase subunit epsilon
MSKLFRLSIVTPDKKIFEGKASSLIAPAQGGYLGVLADHAPLAANLTSGNLIIKQDQAETLIFKNKGKGFLEVLKNNVTVLLTNPDNVYDLK